MFPLDRIGSWLLTRLGLDFDLALDGPEAGVHSITPTLFLGGHPRPDRHASPDSDPVEGLQELGITHVVSCLEEDERPTVAFLDDAFQTTFFPLRDGVHADAGAVLPSFFDVVDGAGPGAKVLVHCQAGVSRSATLVIAQVMRTERLRFYEAYRAVQARRPQVLPNVGFASQLQRFEHTLLGTRSDEVASLTRYLHAVCKVPVELDVLQSVLHDSDYDALAAMHTVFGDEIPRVVQGVRV